MEIGEFDTRVTVLARVNARDTTFRTDVASFLAIDGPLWAKVEDLLPARSEQVVDDLDLELQPVRIWMRWRGDVTAEMRLSIEGREGEYRIRSGPAMLGRRQWMTLTAEKLSSEGQRP